MDIEFELNEMPMKVTAQGYERLSDILRNQCGLTGTKIGCNAGDCGACSVLVDGDIVCSCLLAISQLQGLKVVTIEGLGGKKSEDSLASLQASFLYYGAAQCGICTPGMVMSAHSLLMQTPYPSREQVQDALGGVLCRCTGYAKIIDAVLNGTDFAKTRPKSEAGKNVGSSIPHLDGVAKITGRLDYGSDMIPNDALWIRVIRSPYHHADFHFGDLEMFCHENPGVSGFFHSAHILGQNQFGVIAAYAEQCVFAEKTVRFQGEAVAMLVGTIDAIQGIDFASLPIIWQEKTPLLTPAEAQDGGAVLLHQDRIGNVLIEGYVTRGDVQENMAKSDYRVKRSYETPFIEHAYIEPEAGWARRVGERIEIYGCTQAAQMDRDDIAKIMGLDRQNIRIVPTACGGGFGSKLDLSMQPYLAIAAWYLQKAVGIIYSRSESMKSTTKRHPSEITVEIGCDHQGKITAMDFVGIFNTGAYASWGPTVANRVPVHASGPYFIPHYQAKSVAIHTHTVPAGAFRGFGVPQAAIAQDCAFDELADQVGMDRLEFRLMNALDNGLPTVTGQVFSSGVGIKACLEALQEPYRRAISDARKFAHTTKNLHKGVGIGSCWYGCGNTALPNPSIIRIGIKAEGAIILHQGAMDIGQGSNTVIAQIAADALGVAVAQLQFIYGDTDLTPDAGKTSASRQTFVSGKAAKLTGEALRKKILDHVDVIGEARLQFARGKIIVHADGNQPLQSQYEIDLQKLPCDENEYVFSAQETYDPPTQALDENGQGAPYAVYGYGAQIVELTVDSGLGTIQLNKITAAHDVGRAINPLLVEGQIEGGSTQGIGFALMEKFISGRTENLHDYLIPTIGDVPEFENIIIEVEDAEGPYGAKGLGEHVLIPTAPAILNAIRDATGIAMRDLPVTPDKLYAEIYAQTKESKE